MSIYKHARINTSTRVICAYRVRRFCQELAKQLSEHRVLLVFDPGQQLRPFLDDIATAPPGNCQER